MQAYGFKYSLNLIACNDRKYQLFFLSYSCLPFYHSFKCTILNESEYKCATNEQVLFADPRNESKQRTKEAQNQHS